MDELPRNRFDPIFPVTDIGRSIQHYTALGFQVLAHDDTYAFAVWPGVGCIHLSRVESPKDYDGKVMAAAAYLHVDDAAALARSWKRACPGADTRDPVDTDYGLHEGAHLDLDNNLVRFGSPMAAKP